MDGVLSDPIPVISGVPQGSVLGPLIFLILIGDIDENVLYSSVRSFADDTRIIKAVQDVNDASLLQDDLNSIYQWSRTNNMVFNDVKFELLRYGNNEDVKRNTAYNSSNENVIEEHQSVKDFGVTMSNNCKFNNHINATIINARKLSAWIFRTFKTQAPSPMLTLWKSLVLPKLEYCSQLWNPWLKGNKMNLEMV